jgi:Ca-activated chloride channel family protein
VLRRSPVELALRPGAWYAPAGITAFSLSPARPGVTLLSRKDAFMRRCLPALLLALLGSAPANAAGLLIPSDGNTAPLEMLDHKVHVAIDEQVALTRVEQTFRNPTDRALEATYVFPVPKGASVTRFAMWIDGKEVKGEMVEAGKARSIYTDIVRRMQDPGLLEYVGSNLLKLRVYPVPARGDQKVAVSYTSVNRLDGGLVEYSYPLKTDQKPGRRLEKFSLEMTIRSHQAVQNVYSPTHAVTVAHKGDRTAQVRFERKQALLDKDLHLYYALGKKDVGLRAMLHRPEGDAAGHFLMLISPRAELARKQNLPRDVVLVLDTSGSMSGPKMQQAQKALKFCLDRLGANDRFAVLNFATTVGQFADGLVRADKQHVARARKWVDELEANGGTAIDDALKAALALRPRDTSRTFTVVFFTDGEPTIGETNPDAIVKGVIDRNTSHTRIFTFGVGDDVNATLLDRLAESTRAVSSYVRPEEDIEVKVSSLYAKISHPVLTDLELSAGDGVKLQEVYPGKLPDLFHGGQVVVLGRYTGSGHKAITLRGKVGGQKREFVYEMNFPARTGEEKSFVEGLWARRKVGYLLDEIRRNGEKKELVGEVVKLARKHGIATPYTSYLVVPDGTPRPTAPPVVSSGPAQPFFRQTMPAPRYLSHAPAAPPPPGATPAPPVSATATYEAVKAARESVILEGLNDAEAEGPAAQGDFAAQHLREALAKNAAHTGKLGVDFAVQLEGLRNQNQLSETPAKKAAGRTCRQVGGAWVDEGFSAKMKAVTVKALSKAWFRLMEKHPSMKEVLQLGNRVVWVTPSGAALVIDPGKGRETMSDDEIERLFVR